MLSFIPTVLVKACKPFKYQCHSDLFFKSKTLETLLPEVKDEQTKQLLRILFNNEALSIKELWMWGTTLEQRNAFKKRIEKALTLLLPDRIEALKQLVVLQAFLDKQYSDWGILEKDYDSASSLVAKRNVIVAHINKRIITINFPLAADRVFVARCNMPLLARVLENKRIWEANFDIMRGVTKIFLEMNANPNGIAEGSASSWMLQTCLENRLLGDSILLLEANADVNIRDQWGRTPYIALCERIANSSDWGKYLEILTYFLAYSPNPHLRNAKGRSGNDYIQAAADNIREQAKHQTRDSNYSVAQLADINKIATLINDYDSGVYHQNMSTTLREKVPELRDLEQTVTACILPKDDTAPRPSL